MENWTTKRVSLCVGVCLWKGCECVGNFLFSSAVRVVNVN